ncbi:MAG: hypothetical protein COB02_15810 [Candidatus Cloacimonadota bacterium]|nr:MAG: hypothetical protein COB02_15810 [Candidatus Cloacimonadota bacterium]
MENKKNIPTFKSENEEREFWDDNCSSEFVDWGKEVSDTFLPTPFPSGIVFFLSKNKFLFTIQL